MKPTLTGFAEFCESKPADETYQYHSLGECACAQYAYHIGEDFIFVLGKDEPFWIQIDDLASETESRKFGDLAKRVRGEIESLMNGLKDMAKTYRQCYKNDGVLTKVQGTISLEKLSHDES